jgi:3-oxoacyl-[acyl-carrier-protein] synthase-3
VIDNAFLESLDIDTNEEWIMERVGIRKRHTVLPLDYIRKTKNHDPRAAKEASCYNNAQTGAKAARMAIERAGVSASDIGMVIAGGCSPQWSIPAEACMIANELDIAAPSIDLHSACSSFAAQLHFLSQMHPDKAPEYALIINPENNTRTVNYTDRRTAVLWGDGTAAAVVSLKHPSRARVTNTTIHSDPKGWDKVVIPVAGHFDQHGSAVQAFAIRKSVATVNELRAHLNGHHPTPHFIGHQANLLMLQSVCRRAEVPETHHFFNIDEYGNCGASGAPTVLSQHWDDFSDGDVLTLVVVGSGLTWSGVLVEFGVF